ncbi:MAG: hypothetical protein IV100_22185 [Myxococcales bacterium]|nr:hypothetical protein [Myxococcales bacterium]
MTDLRHRLSANLTASLVTSCVLALGACTYDPPPDAKLPLPDEGVFEVGSALTLTFSEPVDPATLIVRVWSAAPEDRTVENERRPGLEPSLTSCRAVPAAQVASGALTAGTCDEGTSFVLADDGLSAELLLQGTAFKQAKIPWQLEVANGLTDLGGRRTGVPYHFDFQFAPNDEVGTEKVEFLDGVYVLVAPVEVPLPVTLQLIADIVVLDDGRFRWAAGKAVANDGEPKNTNDPYKMHVDETAKGFGVHPQGVIKPDGDRLFMTTESFEINIDLAGIGIKMEGVRITGAIVPDPAAPEQDRVEGTISFANLILDTGEPFEYGSGNAPFAMTLLPKDLITDKVPRLCGNLCGGVTVQCEPPADYPGEEYCPTEAEPSE